MALLAPEAAIGDGEEVGTLLETATMLEVVPTTPAGAVVGTAGVAGVVELRKTGVVVGTATELTTVTGAETVHGQLVMVMVEDSVKVLV